MCAESEALPNKFIHIVSYTDMGVIVLYLRNRALVHDVTLSNQRYWARQYEHAGRFLTSSEVEEQRPQSSFPKFAQWLPWLVSI